MFASFGPLEIGLVLLIVLVIFGPKRLPGLGKQLGRGMREFKESITGESPPDDDDDEQEAGRRAALAAAPAAPPPPAPTPTREPAAPAAPEAPVAPPGDSPPEPRG